MSSCHLELFFHDSDDGWFWTGGRTTPAAPAGAGSSAAVPNPYRSPPPTTLTGRFPDKLDVSLSVVRRKDSLGHQSGEPFLFFCLHQLFGFSKLESLRIKCLRQGCSLLQHRVLAYAVHLPSAGAPLFRSDGVIFFPNSLLIPPPFCVVLPVALGQREPRGVPLVQIKSRTGRATSPKCCQPCR